MKDNLKKYWWAIGIVVLLAIFLLSRLGGQKNNIKSYSVKKVDLKDILSFSGDVNADEKAVMMFQTSGKLSFLKVAENDVVKKGQVLAGLDTGDLRAAEQAAMYKYFAADAYAKQIEDSVKGHDADESYAQKTSRVAAQTDRDIKYDALLTARRALGYATLYSPIEGVVYHVTAAETGQFITAGSPIQFDIINPKTMYLSATADQTDVTKLSEGMEATITLDSYLDKPFKGVIKKIAMTPKEGETGTVYEVKLSMNVESQDYKIRMGMTGDVSFLLKEYKDVVAVPQRFVKTSGTAKYVVVEKNGSKQKSSVVVGETFEGQVIINSGLNEGETIYDQTL